MSGSAASRDPSSPELPQGGFRRAHVVLPDVVPTGLHPDFEPKPGIPVGEFRPVQQVLDWNAEGHAQKSAMRPPEIRSKFSWVPLKVKSISHGKEISRATAFLYRYKQRDFLVTNYHVASGLNPENQVCLNRDGHVPDQFLIGFPEKAETSDGRDAIRWKWRYLDLHENGDYSRPVWKLHPTFGPRCDVAVIPGIQNDLPFLKAANADSLDLDRLTVEPGMDAFVIGFPRGLSGGGHFPLWKRATIASEPDVDIDGLPKFYIDTATREGMSGSPVYAQEIGVWLPQGKSDFSETVFGRGRQFMGVYSGRIWANDDLKLQLGIVWKESAIIEICDSIPKDVTESPTA